MKKIFLIIIISVLSLISCKSEKDTHFMIASSYNGDNEILYQSILAVNSTLHTVFIMRKYGDDKIPFYPYKSHSIPIHEIHSIKNYKVYCEDFKDDLFLTKAIDYAKNNKIRLLIVATPEPVKNNPKEFDIYYKGVDVEDNCKVYALSSFYRQSLTSKGLNTNQPALRKIVNEIEEIINKLD